MHTILVTGAAGFIGHACALQLLKQGRTVIGVDNINDYYDISLKHARLETLTAYDNFTFYRVNIADTAALNTVFKNHSIDAILHLAAQAGVRYSITHPEHYIQSNLVGFANILECARNNNIAHTVYASSSSVYGNSLDTPFKETANTDSPISLYAATKKSNELMAQSYHHLYKLSLTGLRFFTVYGPYGRPDMAPYKFMQKISNGQPIDIYNHGDHHRDFTYIDDIRDGTLRVLSHFENKQQHNIFNIGRGQPVALMDFIEILEQALNKPAIKNFLPAQPGDVEVTYCDTQKLFNAVGYKPKVSLQQGIASMAEWFSGACAAKIQVS